MIKGRKNGSLPGQSIKCATDSCPMGSHPDLSPAVLAGQGSREGFLGIIILSRFAIDKGRGSM